MGKLKENPMTPTPQMPPDPKMVYTIGPIIKAVDIEDYEALKAYVNFIETERDGYKFSRDTALKSAEEAVRKSEEYKSEIKRLKSMLPE